MIDNLLQVSKINAIVISKQLSIHTIGTCQVVQEIIPGRKKCIYINEFFCYSFEEALQLFRRFPFRSPPIQKKCCIGFTYCIQVFKNKQTLRKFIKSFIIVTRSSNTMQIFQNYAVTDAVNCANSYFRDILMIGYLSGNFRDTILHLVSSFFSISAEDEFRWLSSL